MNSHYNFANLPKSALTGKPVLHFAHANGMPSKVYQPLFDKLEAYFTVEYIAFLGATEGYPVDDHWKSLRQQVIDHVTTVCKKHSVQSVVGFGHSLGALSTLRAIYKKPHLFSQAVLCDPPMIQGITSFIWHMAKQLDKLPMFDNTFMDKLSPAGISKNRRDVWESRAAAQQSFSKNKFFSKFDPRCLSGYVKYGLVARDDGSVTLAIPKKNEVAIFRTNPSWYWLTPNRSPKVPVTLLIGADSLFLKRRFPQMVARRLKIPFKTHAGGHMFPLEYPDSVVDMTLDIFNKQQNNKRL